MRFLITAFSLLLWSHVLIGQSATCSDPSPLCTLQSFDFPLGNNINQVPGDYGCFTNTSILPSVNGYYYVEVTTSGVLNLSFTSQNNIGVVAWGPFTSLADASSNCTRLPAPVACSSNYALDTETININGTAGEFYLVYVSGQAPPAYLGQFNTTLNNVPGTGGISCDLAIVDLGCPAAMVVSDCNDPIPAPFTSAFDLAGAGGDFSNFCNDRISLTYSDSDNEGLGCPGDQRVVIRTYSAVDQCGNAGSCTQQITYPILQGPLELICPPSNAPSQLVTCLDDLEVNVQDILAADACGVELSFDIGEPQINDASLGIECDLTCLHYPITVTDECGRVGECTLSFTVFGNVPEFANDIDTTGLECRLAPLEIFCEDDIDAAIDNWLDTLSVFSTCGNSTDLTTDFDANNFVTVCMDTISQTQEIILTATDACGRTNTCRSTINIVKLDGPRIPGEAQDKWVSCSQNVDSIFQVYLADNGGATAIDFCSTVTFTTNPANPEFFISCDEEDGLTIEFIASDICGNTATTSGEFRVTNDLGIVLDTPATDVTVECTNDAESAFDDFVNNQAGAMVTACGNTVWTTDPEIPALPTINDNCDEASTTVVFTATDDCGQQISTTATFTIEDNTAPIIAGGSDLDLTCGVDAAAAIEAWLANNGGLMISDECTGTTVTNDYMPLDFDDTCHDAPIMVTFTVTDACGNETTETLEINIIDNTPPVFTFIPTTLDEMAIAEDECSEVTITTMDEMIGGQIIRTYTATDACGNSATVTVTFGEVDNIPPVIVSIPTEVGCDGVLNLDDIVVTDNSGEVTVTVTLVSQTGSCDMGYTFVYEVTAIDPAGNTTTETVTFDVPADNEPPVLTDVPNNLTFTCSEEVIIPEPTVTDNCDVASLTCTVTLNEFAVMEDCNNGFGFDITKVWTATDACGNTATAVTLAWVVPDDYTGPRFEFVPEDRVLECGDDTTFGEAVCTTACGNLVLTFEDEFLQGDCTQNGEMVRTWTGIDDCGNVSTAEQRITILADTEAPVYTFVQESATIDNLDDMVFGTPTYVDNCTSINHLDIAFEDSTLDGACGLVRTWTVSDLCGNAAQASQTLTIDDNEAPVIEEDTFLIEENCGFTVDFTTPNIYDNMGEVDVVIEDRQLTENCTGLPEFTRTWTATDICGNVSSFTQTKRTVDAEAPLFESLASEKILTCNDEFTFDRAFATDDCTNVQSLSFEDETVTEASCIDCISITRRTWTAIDDCGNQAKISQTIMVRDQEAPALSLTTASTLQIACGEELTILEPNVADNCSSVELTFEDTFLENGCANTANFVRTWTATDMVGNQSDISQTFLFSDNEAPVFIRDLQDVILTCGEELPDDALVLATDNCDRDVEIYLEESIEDADNCTERNVIIRTWTATDNCGNMAVISQRIESPIDTESPTLQDAVTAELVLTCGEDISLEVPNFTDNCSEIELTFNEEIQADICDQIYLRTWTATDACGNATIATQKITVVDDEAPEVVDLLQDLEMSYEAFLDFVAPEVLEASDNCSSVSQVMTTLDNQDCEDYIVTYSYNVTDECGNDVHTSFEVRVTDALPSFELSTPSDVVCGDQFTVDLLDVNAANFELDWVLDDASNTWEVINIGTDQIEILAGEGTVALSLTIQNALGCATTQVLSLECNIVNSVQDLTEVSLLSLSPNPVSQVLNVNFTSTKSLDATIRVFDLLGRAIYQLDADIISGQNEFDIQAENFENGTYILEIATAQGSKMDKFIKL